MAESQKTVSFSLGDRDRKFIENQVAQGRFGNKTEVVRAGLRLLEDYENKQRALRSLIDEGDADIEGGRYTEYDNVDVLIRKITEKHKE